MHEKFKNRKYKLELSEELNNIFVKARELNKTAVMLNEYCKVFINDEKIYNISSVTQLLEDESNSIYKDLVRLVDEEKPKPIPKFLLEITD